MIFDISSTFSWLKSCFYSKDSTCGILGDYIGGLWGTIFSLLLSILTLILLRRTWLDTNKSYNDNKRSDYISHFSNFFLETVRTHDNIISNSKVKSDEFTSSIGEILSEFCEVYKFMGNFFKKSHEKINKSQEIEKAKEKIRSFKSINSDILKYIDKIDEIKNINHYKISLEVYEKLSLKDKIDIAYTFTFFGLSSSAEDRILSIYNRKINGVERNDMIIFCKMIGNYVRSKNDKLLGGNQEYLGHYFRNIYSLYKYVDSDSILSEEEKVRFLNLFRSKLSNYEQALLAINIISSFGYEWRGKDFLLLKKYQPIKDIPRKFLRFDENFSLEDQFPYIDFEFKKLEQIDSSSL